MRPRLIFVLVLIFVLLACNLPTTTLPGGENPGDGFAFPDASPTANPFLPPVRNPNAPIQTPTPDNPHALPTLRAGEEIYVVQPSDTLGQIAQRYGVSVDSIVAANNLVNADVLSIGQELLIPPAEIGGEAPSFKIIPDSELVNGPYNAYFDLNGFVSGFGGYLSQYHEDVEGELLNGAQIIQEVADSFSVNPRLLLAVLEYQSGWLTQPQPQPDTFLSPLGYDDPFRLGLYKQLSWAADQLNYGYYLWRVNAAGTWQTTDGAVLQVSSFINAGTAGVQHFFAQLYGRSDWRQVVSETGFFQTYFQLYGYPFDWAIEPLVPEDLTQPTLQLPFERGVAWTFTGGPHGGYGDGSAWAALDFAPPLEELGCTRSNDWVVAAADGLIVRAANGQVVQDLDGDGNPGTGWTILYMHVEQRGRVKAGTYLRAGERIGHPSCEGGFSTGTHLHLARRYNGEWISADGLLPFVMDGWVSVGTGIYYDGIMQRGDLSVEACECQDPENTLQR